MYLSVEAKNLLFWLVYFLPTIVGVIRKVPNRWFLFFANLTTAWTIAGWFYAWLLVSPSLQRGFRRLILAIAKPGGNSGGAPRPQNSGYDFGAEGQQQRICPNGANGRMICPQCGGKGSWYLPPTTATGTAELERCSYCLGEGSVQCTLCGGTGQVS